jgi:integrase
MQPGTGSTLPPAAPRLMEQVRERIRYLHYSLRTEKAYLYWIRMFVRWSGLRHPRAMGEREVQAFLTMLANERHVSSSTHNQALSALLFLYREVLGIELPWMTELQRPAYARRIPTVLTKDEVRALLQEMQDPIALVARLLYGTGMRLMEAMRLRVKDVDFDRSVIVVREAEGNKDRVVMLPKALVLPCGLRWPSRAARGRRTAPAAGAAWTSRTRWKANTPRSARPGAGSGSSRPPRWPPIHTAAKSAGTTCSKNACNAPSSQRS